VARLSLAEAYEARFALAFLDAAPDRARAEAAIDALGPGLLASGLVALDPDAPGEIHTPRDFSPGRAHQAGACSTPTSSIVTSMPWPPASARTAAGPSAGSPGRRRSRSSGAAASPSTPCGCWGRTDGCRRRPARRGARTLLARLALASQNGPWPFDRACDGQMANRLGDGVDAAIPPRIATLAVPTWPAISARQRRSATSPEGTPLPGAQRSASSWPLAGLRTPDRSRCRRRRGRRRPGRRGSLPDDNGPVAHPTRVVDERGRPAATVAATRRPGAGGAR